MQTEGWWGDYGPAHTNDGPAPKGQKQAPVKPPRDEKKDNVLTAPKIKFGPRP